MGFSSHDFLAGYVGGIAGLLVGHPADTVKVRQQILGTKIIPTIVKTYKYEGIRGFYKGMLFPLLTTGVLNAVFFGCYGNCMRMFSKSETTERVNVDDPQYLSHVFYSGSIAGLVQVLVSCPIEVVKTTLQSKTEGRKQTWKKHYVAPYDGMWSCIKGIHRERGMNGFYRGSIAMIYRDVIASAIYMTTYKHLTLHDTRGNFITFVAGGTAGVVSWVLIIPFDVVKSKMQSDNPINPRYKGMIDCFRQSYKSGGLKVFTRGFWMVCIRAFPVNAAVFVAYEKTLQLLQGVHIP